MSHHRLRRCTRALALATVLAAAGPCATAAADEPPTDEAPQPDAPELEAARDAAVLSILGTPDDVHPMIESVFDDDDGALDLAIEEALRDAGSDVSTLDTLQVGVGGGGGSADLGVLTPHEVAVSVASECPHETRLFVGTLTGNQPAVGEHVALAFGAEAQYVVPDGAQLCIVGAAGEAVACVAPAWSTRITLTLDCERLRLEP